MGVLALTIRPKTVGFVLISDEGNMTAVEDFHSL